MAKKIDPEIRRQRRQLSAWLHEWNLEQSLRRMDIAEHGVLTKGEALTPSAREYPRKGDIAPGRILLLAPRNDRVIDRPIYVLLLAKMQNGIYLIAPFSRFSVPALPGEWLTGLKAAPLRVLCLWNTRGVLRSLLEAGWPATRMSALKIKQAFAVCHDIWQNQNPAYEPGRNVGPPLRHPLDPRHEYIAEEQDILDAATAMSEKTVGHAQTNAHEPALYDWKPYALRLAAEQKSEYGKNSNQ